MPIDLLDFDYTGRQGQIRPLDPTGLALEWRAELLAAPPTMLHRCTLYLRKLGDERYLVLGGQHTVYATTLLRQEALDAHKQLPEWMQTVVADVVLRPDTELRMRKLYSGLHQAHQVNVRTLPLSQLAGLLAEALPIDNPTTKELQQALLTAIHMSGRSERKQNMKALWKDYDSFTYLVKELGSRAEHAFRMLEANSKIPITPYQTRDYRAIFLQPYLEKGAALLMQKVTLQVVKNTWKQIAHDQWVDIHWTEGNPHLAPERGVSLHTE